MMHHTLTGIVGARVLTGNGLQAGAMSFSRGRITAAGSGPMLDAGNMLVLPGIVDLHGDAFERSVMPRPGVVFPYEGALHDVDRQLLAHGITSEFHGVTLSWEGGLRGAPYAQRMLDVLADMHADLGARHYVHLRFETHNIGDVALVQEWICRGLVRFMAFNDHLPSMVKRLGDDRKLLQYAERAECDLDTFQARIRQAMQASGEVAGAMRELAATARRAGLRIASHDDPDCATRRHYHAMDCRVAEFPLTRQAAQAARDLGDAIVFGGPNVVRGRSHTNAPDATEMIRAGLCDILTSDYYYAAPLAAAMRLVRDGVLPLQEAWNLVSRNPALAAGLDDYGVLAEDMAADLIVVDDSKPALPRVCATVVGGVLRYASREFPIFARVA